MPDSLTPVIREEEFLSAIAGESTMPTPVIRKEEFLAEIGNRVDGLAGDVEDLADIVPTPEAADSGKVLTAGADGTASWQTASGGSPVIVEFSFDEFGQTVCSKTYSEIAAAYVPGNMFFSMYEVLSGPVSKVSDGNDGYNYIASVTLYRMNATPNVASVMQAEAYSDGTFMLQSQNYSLTISS